MKSTGKGAVILPHGVLFRSNVEGNIRRNLVRKGAIKGVIGLPANLFYGTSIPACIVVLDKEHAHARKGIFMINASQGFMKDGNKNRLRHQDIHKIVDVFNKQIEIERYSKMVSLAEIEANDYNLNIPRYIDSTEPEDLQDIEAHLKGGIPNRDVEGLLAYWQVCPLLKSALFTADWPGYSGLRVDATQIKPTIFAHPEFVTFTQSVRALFDQWRTNNTRRLKGIKQHDHPKALIETISEDLLAVFAQVPLIDKYDVYQHLMTYWADTMQDDVYMLVADGWTALDNGKPNTDLVPSMLVIARYFAAEQAAIVKLEAERDAITRQMEEMEEEHSGEEGLLEQARTEKGKLTKKSVKARLAEIQHDMDAADERILLKVYLALVEKEAEASKSVAIAQVALDTKVAAKYTKLTEPEIKALVVDDKWLATLAADVQTELDRVSQALTGRIKELADRYATPLPELTKNVETLSAKVDEHLKRMGFAVSA